MGVSKHVTTRNEGLFSRARRALSGSSPGGSSTSTLSRTGIEGLPVEGSVDVDLIDALLERGFGAMHVAGSNVLDDPPSDPREGLCQLFLTYFEAATLVARRLGAPRTRLAASSAIRRLDIRLVGQVAGLLKLYQQGHQLRSDLSTGKAALVLYSTFVVLAMQCIQDGQPEVDSLRPLLGSALAEAMRGWLV